MQMPAVRLGVTICKVAWIAPVNGLTDHSRRIAVKKFVFQGLALAMGLAASSALGQYPGGYGNFGPSAYPVAPQPTMQSLPEVPQGYQPQNIAPMAQQAAIKVAVFWRMISK